MEEIWKDIKGYEGAYQVSNLGQVKSLARKHKTKINGTEVLRNQSEHILKQWKRSSYFLVDLWKNGNRDIRSIHHLVYETFKEKIKNGCFIHHKDENKENNRLENLELVSCLEHNRIHFLGKKGWKRGLKINNLPKKYAKLSPESYKSMWETRYEKLRPRNAKIIFLAEQGKKIKELSDQFGICSRQISDILKEKEKWILN